MTPPPAAEPAPMPPAPAMAATASVSSVDLGNAVGADMKVAAPMTTFAPKDTIHASIATTTSDASHRAGQARREVDAMSTATRSCTRKAAT